MDFILRWFTFYLAVMFAMCIDNIFWISASPEYRQFKFWKFKTKFKYVIVNRVWSVLKHPRDVLPAVITSFLLAVIL